MRKIKVEIEVPKNCKKCMMFDDEYRYCVLFGKYIPFDVHNNIFNPCDECIRSEVEDGKDKG